MNSLRAKIAEFDNLDPFQRSIAISFALHALVASSLLLKAAIFPSDAIIVRKAIRVDVVGLPDKVEPKNLKETTPNQAPEVKAPKKEAPPKTPKAQPDVKKNQLAALNRLKAKSAIDRLKEEQAALEKQRRDQESQSKSQEVKGNVVSEGTSLSGLEQLAFDRYLGDLDTRVRDHWNLPSWLTQGSFRAQAKVLIDETGAVLRKEITVSSGNEIFDEHVMKAIEQASPFPPPPNRLRAVLASRGILLNFPE